MTVDKNGVLVWVVQPLVYILLSVFVYRPSAVHHTTVESGPQNSHFGRLIGRIPLVWFDFSDTHKSIVSISKSQSITDNLAISSKISFIFVSIYGVKLFQYSRLIKQKANCVQINIMLVTTTTTKIYQTIKISYKFVNLVRKYFHVEKVLYLQVCVFVCVHLGNYNDLAVHIWCT